MPGHYKGNNPYEKGQNVEILAFQDVICGLKEQDQFNISSSFYSHILLSGSVVVQNFLFSLFHAEI